MSVEAIQAAGRSWLRAAGMGVALALAASAGLAQSITMGLYPFLLVEQATLDATDAFLAQDGLNSACRRLVGEGRDGVVRAMRARATDAAS